MELKNRIIKHPFKCLLIIFFVIYILSTFLVSYLIFNNQLKSVSRLVLNTLKQESEKFHSFFDKFYFTGYIEPELEGNLLALTSKNFSLIKIFDKNSTAMFISNVEKDKSFMEISDEFFKEFKQSNSKKKTDFFFYKRNLYIILIESIGDKGFIEAIYKIPNDMKKRIIFNLKQSIKIVSFVLLITFLITFLIVNSFTETIKDFNISLLKENINSLQTIGFMIAKRDSETGEHNYRVTYYAVKIAEHIDMPIDFRALIKGAFLHDIGKIAIPDNILLKPAKLTDKEFEIMKTHVLHGYEIIKNNNFLSDAVDVVLYHHEKVDGTGYMKGLKGEEIPINARIFAVADVFDALTSKRPYKQPFSFEKSLQIIQNDKGKHFCPFVVEAFEKVALELYKEIKEADSHKLEKLIQEIIFKYFR